jgi:oligopeptide transport system ATP-binding protein
MTLPILEVDQLNLTLFKGPNAFHLLRGVSFNLYPGEIVALVGESGSGKSLTASSLFGLLPSRHAIEGKIIFEGKNLLSANISHPRGDRLSLILQDPALALNPLMTIGKQLVEGLIFHKNIQQKKALEIGLKWLKRVGIGDPALRMKQFPHELSGGMKQRILIAMALICQPSLLIADEPTTALDVTVQAQILDLLKLLHDEEGMSILLITHDLGVVAQYCHRVLVMYAGEIVEEGSTKKLFKSPRHPYTQALLKSRCSLDKPAGKELFTLEGQPPLLQKMTRGCSFAPRCAAAMRICLEQNPPRDSSPEGNVLCWLPKANERSS